MSNSKGCSIPAVIMAVIITFIIGVTLGAGSVYVWTTMNPVDATDETDSTAEQVAPPKTEVDDRYAVLIPIEQTLRVEGPLPVQEVRDKLLSRRFELRKCYQKGIDANDDLKGELSVQFTVAGSNGKVTAALERHTQFPDPSVRDCIVNDIKAWKFPGDRASQSVVKFDILMLSMSAAEAKP